MTEFLGYRFTVRAIKYLQPPIDLPTPHDVYAFLKLEKSLYEELRVVAKGDDSTIAQALYGRVVFPPNMAILDFIEELTMHPENFTPAAFMEELKEREVTRVVKVPNDIDDAFIILQDLLDKALRGGLN